MAKEPAYIIVLDEKCPGFDYYESAILFYNPAPFIAENELTLITDGNDPSVYYIDLEHIEKQKHRKGLYEK